MQAQIALLEVCFAAEKMIVGCLIHVRVYLVQKQTNVKFKQNWHFLFFDSINEKSRFTLNVVDVIHSYFEKCCCLCWFYFCIFLFWFLPVWYFFTETLLRAYFYQCIYILWFYILNRCLILHLVHPVLKNIQMK